MPNFVAEGICEMIWSYVPLTLAIEPISTRNARVRLGADGWTVRTADGRPSAHFEHTVAVTREGPEILTAI